MAYPAEWPLHTYPPPGARANHLPILLVIRTLPADEESTVFDLRATHARKLRPTALVCISYERVLVRVRVLASAHLPYLPRSGAHLRICM